MAYTKSQLNLMLFDNLSSLATDAGFTRKNASSQADGFDLQMTFALITVVGENDVTLVTDSNLISVLSWAELFALKKLYNYYLTAVDFKLGPREEKLSQIARGIENLTKDLGVSNQTPIVFKDMTWTFNDFTTSGVSSWPINWFEIDYDRG